MGIAIFGLVLAAAVVAGYVWLHGAPSHDGVSLPWSSLDPQSIPGAVIDAIHNNPHILVLAGVSVALAVLLKWFWGKIGTAGRGAAMIGFGVFLAYAVGHR